MKALELDAEAAGYTGSEPVHFGGFPGVWEPGRPIALTELGFDTEKAAAAAVKELELPLREVQANLDDARMPPRPNHALSEEQARTLDEAAAQGTPVTHAQADAEAAAAGLTFPASVKTVAEKVAFLDDVREGRVTVAGERIAPAATEGENG